MIRLFLAALALACLLSPADAKSRHHGATKSHENYSQKYSQKRVSLGFCVESGSVMQPACMGNDFLAGVRSIRVTMKRERQATKRRQNITRNITVPIGDAETPQKALPEFRQRNNINDLSDADRRHRGGLTFQPSSMTDLVSRARSYMGTNPTGWRSVWCGRFMAMIAPAAAARVHNPNVAKAWLVLRHTSGSVGDIAVLGRRGGGHVGVVTGFDSAGNPIIVSGNHGRRVGEGVYAKGRVLAFVSPG